MLCRIVVARTVAHVQEIVNKRQKETCINWMQLMRLAPNIFENCCLTHDWRLSMFGRCVAVAFCHVSAVSPTLFFQSTLSQGHLSSCDMHTCKHTHNHTIFCPFSSTKFGQTPLH